MQQIMSIFVIISIILLDFLTAKGIKSGFPIFSSRNWQKIKYAIIVQAVVAISIALFGVLFQKKISDFRIIALYYYFFGGVAALYAPKSIYALFVIFDWSVAKIKNQKSKIKNCRYGFWVSLPVTCVVVWGILFGQYNFKVENIEVACSNLPQAFNNYKIVQISDVHTGSFARSSHRFQKVVDLINEQKPDLIVMTGDIVNNFADELIAFIPIFSQLNAHDGKFAVLGNHDYGGYYKWKNPADSVANFNALVGNIEEMGFEFLNNRAVIIQRGDADSIALTGVENWGVLKRFPKRADLNKALNPVRDVQFKVLITHDPSLWAKEVEGKTDIALTLTGHTHGMQMGVKIGDKRYTPAPLFPRFRRHSIGLYKTGEQYLYISRGLGVIGFPARIGMPPEITVITLKNQK